MRILYGTTNPAKLAAMKRSVEPERSVEESSVGCGFRAFFDACLKDTL